MSRNKSRSGGLNANSADSLKWVHVIGEVITLDSTRELVGKRDEVGLSL